MKASTSGRVIWTDMLPFDCRHEVVSFAIRRSSQAQLGAGTWTERSRWHNINVETKQMALSQPMG